MARRWLSAALCSLLWAVTACSGGTPPDPTPGPSQAVYGDLGVFDTQLVTEAYERRQKDITIAVMWAQIFGEVVAGYPNNGAQIRAQAHAGRRVGADTWDKDRQVHVSIDYGWEHPSSRLVRQTWYVTFTFGGPVYSAGGSVTTSGCTTLPGGGEVSTGEFRLLDNTDGTVELEENIEHGVTESKSTETSLTESLELSSGQTIEAGAEFGPASAKATVSFEEHFKVDTGSVASTSTDHTETIAEKLTVPAGRKFALAYTVNDQAQDCGRDINAAADWSNITVDLTEAVQHTGASGLSLYGQNGDLLSSHECADIWSPDHQIKFTEADDIVRFVKGYDVRCPHAFSMTGSASETLDRLADPTTRWISFKGKTHTVTKADASFTVKDVTGQDDTCIQTQFGTPGVAVDSLGSC